MSRSKVITGGDGTRKLVLGGGEYYRNSNVNRVGITTYNAGADTALAHVAVRLVGEAQ